MQERKFLNSKLVEGIVSAFADGTIFSVVFEKKDGTLRRMVCRTGVTRDLKGGVATYDKDANIGVFDTEADGYRCFPKAKVLRIKGGGAQVEACAVGEIEEPIHNARGESVKVK